MSTTADPRLTVAAEPQAGAAGARDETTATADRPADEGVVAGPAADTATEAARPDGAGTGTASPLPTEADELVQTIFGLFGAARRLRGRDQQRPGELSHSQLRIVTHLLDAGEPLPAGALARAVELNPASMTAAIDHLEQRGVVRREPFPGDRRVVLVRLTDEGRALVVAKREAWDRRWHEALAQVDPADLAITAKTLQRVSALVDEL